MPYLKKATPQKTNSNKREERQKIYNTTIWKKLRAAKLLESPLCEMCLKHNKITSATDVHHIDSFMNYTDTRRLSKAYDARNLMSLCKECHQKEHNQH